MRPAPSTDCARLLSLRSTTSRSHGKIFDEEAHSCYDHVQLRVLSGHSGRSHYSGHGRADNLPLSTTLGLCSIRSLPHLAVYPALT